MKSRLNDPISQQCLHALSHPLTLAAVIVLLVNDHILRVYWPSWVTGKLGDLAWLAFFPLTLAAPLAWIIPSRFEHRRVVIPALAFGFTAALFISMKTIPAALDAGLWVLSQIIGGPFTLHLDPTDLLTLPGLAAGWWVWRQSERPAPASRGWVVLALGVLATVANGPGPIIIGVSCVFNGEGGLFAVATRQQMYSSMDGGLSWQFYKDFASTSSDTLNERYPCDDDEFLASGELVVNQLGSPDALFRVSYEKVERSFDGGKTWVQELDLTHTEAEWINFYSKRYGVYITGPTDSLIDSQTGNLIVALGAQGVLVRTPDGVWTSAAVGEFKPVEKMNSVAPILNLLSGNIVLAGILFVLLAATINIWSRYHHAILIPIYALTWLCWIFILLANIGGSSNYSSVFFIYVFPITLILFLIILSHAATTKTPGRAPNRVKWIAGGVAIPLFLLPYIFWTQGIIPMYSTATMFSLTLVACVLFGAILESHPVPPPEEPAKPDAPPIP